MSLFVAQHQSREKLNLKGEPISQPSVRTCRLIQLNGAEISNQPRAGIGAHSRWIGRQMGSPLRISLIGKYLKCNARGKFIQRLELSSIAKEIAGMSHHFLCSLVLTQGMQR
jgi:hypothetical protein